MRVGRAYACPQCGSGSAFGSRCDRCDVWLVDENGNAPPAASLGELEFDTAKHVVLGMATYGLTAPFSGVLRLAHEVRRLNARRRARRAVEAVGPAVPIAEARDGIARVRGTVTVIEAVRAPGGRSCAAYLHLARADSLKEFASPIVRSSGCGRFEVRDDTGVAFVDDDFIDIVDTKGSPLRTRSSLLVTVSDGDTVDIVGPCRRVASSGGGHGYREAPTDLRFDGSSAELVRILTR